MPPCALGTRQSPLPLWLLGASNAEYILAMFSRNSSMYAVLASCEVEAAFLGGLVASRQTGRRDLAERVVAEAEAEEVEEGVRS